MKIQPVYLVAAGLVGVALLYVKTVGAQQAGRQLGAAASDMAGGVLIGAGETVGVPATDGAGCAAAKAAGDTWAASFACPAGEFLGWLWNR